MQKILPISSILSCGVWHKAPNTLSTLDEAVAALGPGAYIINGGTFNGNGTPDSAYIIDEVTYSIGWSQYGFSLRPPNFVQWTYLNTIKYPDFIGAYGAYLINGDNTRTITDATTMRTTLGLAADGVYIAVENTTIERSLSQAAARGCATAINLDGGGSSQYHLPDGTNYYGTVPKRRVLNWVYFKMKEESKMPKVYLSPSNQYENKTLADGKSECDLMNELADMLEPMLTAAGIEVLRAGRLEKVTARVQASNQYKPDLDLQLHSNAGGGTGTETLIIGTGGQAEKCAKLVQAAVVKATGMANRGVKVQSDYELKNTTSPAILVECFFHDNAKDVNYWLSNKAVFARAIRDGVCEWLGIPAGTEPAPGPEPGKTLTWAEAGELLRKAGVAGVVL